MSVEGKQVLIVATFGPDNPERCPAAFLFATEAANGGARVGINFVLQAPLLVKRGVAETLRPKEDGRTIREFLDEALEAGVDFYVCDAALDLCAMVQDDLIDEVDQLVGPNFLITKGLEADLVLNF
jgi:predicted peroxiredoxin